MKRFYAWGRMIEYAPITVSYAWELTSVSMCYSQGDGFNTSLFRFLQFSCAHSRSISSLTDGVSVLCDYVRWYGHVLPRTTLTEIMCVHYLNHQG